MIEKDYIPKSFGKEYVEVKSSAQYPMFAAVALGIKSSFDDWIDVSKYDAFTKICGKYGLYVEPDVVFSSIKTDKAEIIGGQNVTTTFSGGMIFSKDTTEGKVHVMVSKDKNTAIEAKKFGDYGVVINNRTMNKPFVDHLRFGRLLGFPDCCVDFFRRYNNWNVYNHPYETLKNTKMIPEKAIGSYYCNNILMDKTFFYIHHLPCSYRCEKTIAFAKKLEEEIRKVEPDFVKRTISILKMPLLVFGEKNFIIFNGTLDNAKTPFVLEYQNAEYFSNYARPEESINFFDKILEGNKITVDNNVLKVYNNDDIIFETRNKNHWFLIDFD